MKRVESTIQWIIKSISLDGGLCRGECNRTLTKRQRYFYVIKAVVAMILRRRTSLYGYDHITVAMANASKWTSMDFVGAAWDWEELTVPPGFWNWRYDIYSNSSA